MKKYLSKVLAVLLFFGPFTDLSAQALKIIQDLAIVEGNLMTEFRSISDKEKIKMLSLLPAGEAVLFEMPGNDPDDPDKMYFPLDTSGIYIIDLNFDKKPDLLYSSQSGNQGLTSTKIYINQGGKLVYKKYLSGSLLHIEKNESAYSIFTASYPCCDSYTAKIDKYTFSSATFAQFEESVSMIGRCYLKGLPDLSGSKTLSIENPELYAFPVDFKMIRPYFRERNKSINDSIRAGYNIKLIGLKGPVKLNILYTKTDENETWLLVITEALNAVRRSLYEWSDGDKRRFVGWIKENDFE